MATHLFVTAARGGHKTLFQNIISRVSEKYHNVFQNVLSKVTKQVEPKAKWANKNEAGYQIKSGYIPVGTSTLSRQAFTKLFPQKSMQTFASEWRLITARKLITSGFGRKKHIPIFAFVGLGFAVQEESFRSTNQEFICTEIRKHFSGFDSERKIVTETKKDLHCQDFQFGEFIAKGSCSAVYDAKFASSLSTDNTSAEDDTDLSPAETEHPVQLSTNTQLSVQFTDNYTEPENTSFLSFGAVTDVDLVDESHWNVHPIQSSRDTEHPLLFADNYNEQRNDPFPVDGLEWNVSPLPSLPNLAVSSDADDDFSDVDEAEFEVESPGPSSLNNNELGVMLDVGEMSDFDDTSFAHDKDNVLHSSKHSEFDLAIKMMFNYSAESTAEAVTMAMEKETVPMKLSSPNITDRWKFWRHRKKKKCQPPHPNIVDLKAVFVDQVANLPGNIIHYPAALPQRLNPDGFGRNMTMFLVMKRYSDTLRDYLESENRDVFECCILISQILEGVTFLGDSGVAHRDLKSDNILMDLTNQGLPWLVISDFGCCLSDDTGLQIPYNTREVPKGGNSALMAPEIACAKPGWFSVLDYSKSDLWTVGSLVYEVFGEQNPFYRLDSMTYNECDLPQLPENCPWIVRKLVSCLLQRDPCKRLEPAVASNVMQLFLWWPRLWFTQKKPSKEKVQEWLMTFYREVAYHEAFLFVTESDASVEHKLQRGFLSRLHFQELIAAVDFIFD